jgi:hypothetical protein
LPRLHIETLEDIVNEAKTKTSFATSRPIPIPRSPLLENNSLPLSMEIKEINEIKNRRI